VLQRLQQLLNDQLALLDALSVPGDDAALLQALLRSARARGQAWPKLAPEQCDSSCARWSCASPWRSTP
jgi:hypothetical protein